MMYLDRRASNGPTEEQTLNAACSTRRSGRSNPCLLCFMINRIVGIVIGLALTCLADPLSAAPYKISAGDTLRIEVMEDPSLDRTVLVLPDGSISFPLVGSLPARGRTVDGLRQDLARGLAPNFAAMPTVTVAVAELAEPVDRPKAAAPQIGVYIVGEVDSPGKLDIPPGTTILQLLAESGGFTAFAATSRIELHRTDPTSGSTAVYLYSFDGRGRGARIPHGTRLTNGDVVIVRARRLFE